VKGVLNESFHQDTQWVAFTGSSLKQEVVIHHIIVIVDP
jgi:hypothetical protein